MVLLESQSFDCPIFLCGAEIGKRSLISFKESQILSGVRGWLLQFYGQANLENSTVILSLGKETTNITFGFLWSLAPHAVCGSSRGCWWCCFPWHSGRCLLLQFFPCSLPIPQAIRDKSKCQGLILCAHPISTSIILDKHLIEQNECFTTESWQIVHLGTPIRY